MVSKRKGISERDLNMFGKMKLGMRVSAALAAMLVLVIVMGVYGIKQVQQGDDSDSLL